MGMEFFMHANDVISIGDLAARTGLSVSAIRFYEAKRLIAPFRTSGNQRRFLRSDIRRLSFIRIAQAMGLSIEADPQRCRLAQDQRSDAQPSRCPHRCAGADA
jgi:MerR family transcriptional regulator, redox-sensitive transcriptional activator SoxR